MFIQRTLLMVSIGLLVSLLSDQCAGQLQRRIQPQAVTRMDDVLEKSFKPVDGYLGAETDFQLEGGRGQVEMDALEDEKLDSEDLDPSDIPSSRPSNDEVRDMLVKAGAISSKTRLASINPYVAYTESMRLVTWRCCPRRQGYGCRSYYRPLPCFTYAGQRCCAIWPQNLRQAYCNCSRCAILTHHCASVGRCQRRYRSQRIWAACYNGRTWYVRNLIRNIATSCYCRATNLNWLTQQKE